MKPRKRSSTVERRKSILQMLNESGQVLVHELSKKFDVSEVTIRNDLAQLEKKYMLIRARGGAIKTENGVGIDYRLSEKDKLNNEEKARIGKKAVQLINEHDTIIIDSGTTTMELAKNLGQLSDITVICNALNIISHLIQLKNVSLIIPGGYLRKNSLSLVGPLAEKNLQNLFVDKVFIGVDGFDTRHGIYTPNIEEAYFNEIMIKISKEVIVVCDSSKFLRRSLAYICNISKIHCVITDSGIPDDDRKRLEDAGIRVIIA
jgi:DeoR family transcriptional regulator, aga operon transcriptional repressor